MGPSCTSDLIDMEGSRSVWSKTNSIKSTRAAPGTNKVKPKWQEFRDGREEPKCKKSGTDVLESK